MSRSLSIPVPVSNLASELWCASFQKSMGVTLLFEELKSCEQLAADPNRKLTPRGPQREASAVRLRIYTSSWLLLCTSECCKLVCRDVCDV